MSAGRPFPTVWLLVFLGALSVCIQHVTVVKFSVFAPGSSHVRLTGFLRAVEQEISFGLLDGLLAALFLLAAALLLYGEARHRALTGFLQDCFDSPRKTLWLLTGCLLVSLRYYLSRGELSWSADASHHIAHSWLAARAIADGQVPVWTFFIGTGSPVFQTYGFAFFYLVGLADLVFGDFFLSLKLVMAAGHLVSGLGMYHLASSLCRSRPAGFIAGLGYALCFWHAQHVLIMGRLPLSLFYALLPWAFYWIEQVVDSRRRMRAALLGGVSLALLGFTHPGYGAFAMALAGCYGLVRLWSCRGRPDRGAVLRAGLLLFVLGIAFGSYMNVGMYFERGHTRDARLRHGPVERPDPTWRHLLGWSNFRFWLIPPEPYHWYGGYLGISLCVMALAGGAAALRRREGRFAACWVCLVLTLLVVVGYRLPPISTLPLIHAFNASRYLLFLAFFLALAAGIGAHLLLQRVPGGPGRSRRCTLLLLALGIDLFPTTFLQPYYPGGNYLPTGWRPETFAEAAEAAAPFQERGELPNYRAHWIGEGVYAYKRRAQMLYMGKTPIAEAFHPGELRTLNAFTKPFTDWAQGLLPRMDSLEELEAARLDALLAGFRLLDTRYVIATSNQRGSGFAFSLESSPIVVSGRLAGYDEGTPDLDGINARFGGELDGPAVKVLGIILRTGLQPGSGLACERILVRGLEGERDLGTKPTARVLDHRVDHQQVEMRVAVSARCHARLAYGYFPYLQVTVDGSPVEPMETAGRFMAIPLEAGEHDIAIRARLSPLRKGLLLLAGVCLAGALALVLREHGNDREEVDTP